MYIPFPYYLLYAVAEICHTDAKGRYKKRGDKTTRILRSGFLSVRLRKMVKSEYQVRHVCLSVRPNVTIRLPLDGLS
jgi:hypothetical protein